MVLRSVRYIEYEDDVIDGDISHFVELGRGKGVNGREGY